jgi:hypothetical protein
VKRTVSGAPPERGSAAAETVGAWLAVAVTVTVTTAVALPPLPSTTVTRAV